MHIEELLWELELVRGEPMDCSENSKKPAPGWVNGLGCACRAPAASLGAAGQCRVIPEISQALSPARGACLEINSGF